MARPENFEFAMSFLGGKDADDVRRYVQELEKALREMAECPACGDVCESHRSLMERKA